MPFHTVIAALLLTISSASHAGDLFDLLQRMADADHDQNYQGIFILRKSDKLSTLKVTHGHDDKGVWESLETLDGESRKVVRRNNRVVSIYPARELVTIRHRSDNKSLHLQLPDNIDQLNQFYSLQRLEDDRIADRQTLVVDLMPKDQYRYGYRYWVDQDTGMLLRCDLLDEEMSVVEQMMFTSLEYLKISPVQSLDLTQFEQYEQLQLDAHEMIDQQAAGQQNFQPGWQVDVLPEGFMLTQSTMRHSEPAAMRSDAPADLLHMVYSDGLASVSVFIEKNQGAGKHLPGASNMGAVNAFGQPAGDYFVTVVGEVPIKTVKTMALSTVRSQ